jgi:3-oxoadipate enol-lactonase
MSEVHHIRVAGNSLHAVVEGAEDKPWLTCLHTLAGNLTIWDELTPALGKDFRLLLLDARGHGQSTAETEADSLADLVADVAKIWDELGIRRSGILGISLGGMTGVGLALTHPDRVEKLVAADCRLDAPQFFVDMWAGRQKQLKESGMEAVAEATLPIWFSEKTRTERPQIVERARTIIGGTSAPGYMGASRSLQKLDYKKRVAEIACPTLYLVGELDGPHPKEMREFAEMTPGAKFAEIPGVAHMANMEAPDAFAKIVLDFLRSS